MRPLWASRGSSAKIGVTISLMPGSAICGNKDKIAKKAKEAYQREEEIARQSGTSAAKHYGEEVF